MPHATSTDANPVQAKLVHNALAASTAAPHNALVRATRFMEVRWQA